MSKNKELIGFEIGTKDTRHFLKIYIKKPHTLILENTLKTRYASYNLISLAKVL